MNINLSGREETIKMFDEVCKKIDIKPTKEDIENLVVYEMTDGTRTSFDFKNDGWKGYYEGGIFCLRFMHMLKHLGGKNIYFNVIHERHKQRVNYEDIYRGLMSLVEPYSEYLKNNDIKIKFVGDYKESIAPNKAENDLRLGLKKVEEMTKNNNEFNAYVMLNYSALQLAREGGELWNAAPPCTVILRHCKGYVNGDMWLPGKLDNHTFVYAQNGTISMNWTDKQILYLIGLSLRSYILNKGGHYSKIYGEGENERIKRQREQELYMEHKKLEETVNKRVVLFGVVGPEVYEF
ncbi:MAG: hypothetical protein V1911_02305 [Candidatus Micrarchaeota archaeon]